MYANVLTWGSSGENIRRYKTKIVLVSNRREEVNLVDVAPLFEVGCWLFLASTLLSISICIVVSIHSVIIIESSL